MLVYAPRPSVYLPRKRQKTTPAPDEGSSRSVSPAGSFYTGARLRSHDLPPRSESPAGSFYSHYSASSSSPSIASSSGSNKKMPSPPPPPPPLPNSSSWLARSPRSVPALSIVSPTAAELASAQFQSPLASTPPDTPIAAEVPPAELRRRQLDKATRILGESVPLELVFQPRDPLAFQPAMRAQLSKSAQSRDPLVQSFPDPPPRRSAESPLTNQQPREMLTERHAGGMQTTDRTPRKGGAGKIVRRASLSLTTLTSKFPFRPGSRQQMHSRDSSQESQSSSSDQSYQSQSPLLQSSGASGSTPRLQRPSSLVVTSPIMFAYPRRPGPQIMLTADADADAPVLDIRLLPPSPSSADAEYAEDDSSAHLHRDDDDASTPAPAHAHPRFSFSTSNSHSTSTSTSFPRFVPLSPADSDADSEVQHPRAGTPFNDYVRPDTPFADYLSRPGTPFTDLTRPGTPFTHLARPGTPFTDFAEPAPAQLAVPNTVPTSKPRAGPTNKHLGVSRRERGQGWSGEWNRGDMQDVISRLRTLK